VALSALLHAAAQLAAANVRLSQTRTAGVRGGGFALGVKVGAGKPNGERRAGGYSTRTREVMGSQFCRTQLGWAFNDAKEMTGLQLGIVNDAESLHRGLQIGLVNIAKTAFSPSS